MREGYLLDDMVDSWLRKDDDIVETSGHPSWQSLVKALEEAGCTGVATTVRKSMSDITYRNMLLEPLSLLLLKCYSPSTSFFRFGITKLYQASGTTQYL